MDLLSPRGEPSSPRSLTPSAPYSATAPDALLVLDVSPAPAPVEETHSAPPVLWRDARLWLVAGCALVLVLLLSFSLHAKGTPAKGMPGALWPLMLAACGASSAFVAFSAASTKARRGVRVGWMCLALVGALFGFGCLLGLSHRKLPALSEDVELARGCLLVLGLLALSWRGRALDLWRLVFDAVIIALAVLILIWTPTLRASLATLVAGLHPVWALAGAFCVLARVRGAASSSEQSPRNGRVQATLLLAALGAELGVTFGGAAASKGALGATSVLLLALAALLRGDEGRAGRDEEADSLALGPLRGEWLPSMATILAVCLWLWRLPRLEEAATELAALLWPVFALLLALAGRGLIAAWEGSLLIGHLRSSNASLERNVGERTRHLAMLHAITSTLNTSLDRRTVLRVTLEKTIAVTGASAGGIWLLEARRDVYDGSAPHEEWRLMHWLGDEDPAMPSLLRDLAIFEAGEGALSPAFTPFASAQPLTLSRKQLLLVPVRSQGALLGVMGLMRREGEFSYDDRALVESVAFEAGTALQNAQMYFEAAHRADRDSVTDLLNHRAVQEQLAATLSRCKKTSGVFSLVMMDLNNFKFFNDTYGHPVGDDVLRTVAASLREACRGSDILGRYGGDEFIVVLPDTDASGTLDVCARIKATLDARHFEPVPGTKLPIGTAFGWAAYPRDGETIMDLLGAADSALYNHKRGGAAFLAQSERESQENRDALKRLKSRMHGGSFGVLDALVTAIDNKDHYTRHHSEEVTYLSLLVARELGYSTEALDAVRISGLLHDVGKIAVPDQILRHPGKLGRDEWEIMQQHPVFGALIVKDVPHLEPVVDGIKYHHEKWDGSGYPEKLKGEAIPEMGRLLAMADCYSALTTDRPYRKGWKPEAALEEIERCCGSHFDPRLCAVFLSVMRRELAKGAAPANYEERISDEFADGGEASS